jgi:hypothetical protein
MVTIQSDQQENKSRVLPHLLCYRNVSLSLIVHICTVNFKIIDRVHLKIQEVDLLQFFAHVKIPF